MKTIPSGYSEWLRLQLQKHEPEPLCPFGPIECHVAYEMRYCWPCKEARAAYRKHEKKAEKTVKNRNMTNGNSTDHYNNSRSSSLLSCLYGSNGSYPEGVYQQT